MLTEICDDFGLSGESWPARLRRRAGGFPISGFSVGSVLAARVYNWVVPSPGRRWTSHLGLIPIAIAPWTRRALPEAEDGTVSVAEKGAKLHPFRPLFAPRGRAVVNTVLAVVAAVSLFLVFTPGDAGMVPVLSVAAGVALASFAVQLGGRRGRVLYLSMIGRLFFAILYSWPIEALLPTPLKAELGYSADQVTDVRYFAGFGTMAGCWTAGFLGDRIGAKKAHALTLLASPAFVYPVFAVHDGLPLLGGLLFLLRASSFGFSGLLPYGPGSRRLTHGSRAVGHSGASGPTGGPRSARRRPRGPVRRRCTWSPGRTGPRGGAARGSAWRGYGRRWRRPGGRGRHRSR